jgi:iron complex transport system substrate-binding protein
VTTPIGRRRALATLAAGVAATVAACGTGSPSAPETGSSPGGWSFTDDTGRKVTSPSRPTRIAGFSDAVASLWNYGIEPVAVFGYKALTDDPSFRGKDLSGVAEVGRAYGQIDIESLAAAAPDLIVTHVYPSGSGALTGNEVLYGFANQSQVDTVRRIAPIVAIAMTGTADKVAHRTRQLAESLGVDFSTPRLRQAQQDYEDAGKRLAAASKKNLTVMAEAAYASKGVYIAKAPDDPSLSYYAELGVTFLDPGGDEYYWHTASWEQLGTYRSDVILNSTRAMSVPEAMRQPTFAALPAAAAHQVFPWKSQTMDYFALAKNLNGLAAHLQHSRRVV